MFRESCRHALRGRLCVAVIAALVAAAPASLRAEALTPDQQRAHDIYKELVEIDTTTATGDTRQAADAMAARLKAAGFPDADVQVFSPAPRKGNLVARYHGSGARKPILLVAHLDVEVLVNAAGHAQTAHGLTIARSNGRRALRA